MTTTKILTRLVYYAPPVLHERANPGGRCVLATRLGIDVLARFGLHAEPHVVVAEIANAAYIQWIEDGAPGGDQEQLARGAWLVSNDPAKRRPHGGHELPAQVPPPKAPWDGHLVLVVRDRQRDLLVDLDVQQFARPTRGIVPPPALVLPWNGDLTGSEFRQGGGACAYRPWPADQPIADFRTAPDWQRDLRDIVDPLVRAVRKGTP